MWTTVIIAWRNIWRHPVRSSVVIGSILFGVWSVIVMMSLSLGMGESYIQNIIKNQYSHLQIHHPEFKEEQESRYIIRYDDQLDQIPGISHYTKRILINGMLSTSYGARGVQIKGIDPESENEVSQLSEHIKEGEYLNDEDDNGLLVSQKMTEKFRLKVRSRVVITFQDSEGEMVSQAYRVKGIYNTGNAMVDENQIFIKNSSLRPLVFADSHPGDQYHEIAIEVEDVNQMTAIQEDIQNMYPAYTVENYKELAPDLALMESQIRVSGLIFIVIFMLALIFGIINTMLMAVLERYRELGMLQAIGMPKSGVFSMVVLETFFLSIVGVPLGYLFGWLSVLVLKDRGLDLSTFSKGMQQFGMSEKIYPVLDTTLFVQLGIAVAITSLLAALYPSWKAISLKPVDAIRKL